MQHLLPPEIRNQLRDKVKGIVRRYGKNNPALISILAYQRSRDWIQNHPEESKLHQRIAKKKRFGFKGKNVYLDHNPRTGTCAICKKDCKAIGRRTSLHHHSYDDKNPLAYTVEVCNSCHTIITHSWSKGNYVKVG